MKRYAIVIEKAKADEEKLLSAVLDAGADDMQDDDDNWEVLSAPGSFEAVREAVGSVLYAAGSRTLAPAVRLGAVVPG